MMPPAAKGQELEPLTMRVCYTLFETELGWMGLVGSVAGLRRTVLPQPSPEAALDLLARGLPGAIADLLESHINGMALERRSK